MPRKTDRRTHGVTRSGYRYQIVHVDEIARTVDGDWFTWTCGEENCGLLVQGGAGALAEHRRVVHGDGR
jgi:hypothetical protein